jgi:AcrR family transcriptional regulator
MSRWEPNARERLEQAALELFVAQGFAETTVPQIAQRAGLTTRTFFRHFSDKREVLFADEDDIPVMAARMIAEAPASLSTLEVVASGLETVATALFGGDVEHVERRRAVIDADDSLRERELRKLAALTDAISQGFALRGVDALTSTLVAHVTTTVFSVSIERWLAQHGSTPLADLLRDTLEALQGLMVPVQAPRRGLENAPSPSAP